MNEMMVQVLERRGLTLLAGNGGECKGCFLKNKTECFNHNAYDCLKVMADDEMIGGDYKSRVVGLKEEMKRVIDIIKVHE